MDPYNMPDLQIDSLDEITGNQAAAIANIEEDLEKLHSLAATVEQGGGMSKEIAVEAMKIIPEFGNGTPMAYYTVTPSIARYTEAMEELSAGVWALIVAAGAALIALAVKFIKWLFGDKSSSDRAEKADASFKAFEKNANQFCDELDKQLTAAISKFETDGGKTGDVVEGEAKVVKMEELKAALEDAGFGNMPKSLNQLIDKFVKGEGKESSLARALTVEDPLFYDITHNGEYSKTIKSTANVVSVMPVAVDTSAKTYVKLVEEVKAHISSLGNSKKDENPVDVTLNQIELDMFGNGKRIRINEGVSTIEVKRKAVLEGTGKDNVITFTKLNELYAKALENTNIPAILKKIDSTKNHMDSLLAEISKANADLEKMNTHEVTDPVSVKYSHKLKEAFRNVRLDVISCFKFYHEIMQYANNLFNMGRRLSHIQKEALRVVEKELKSHNLQLTDEMKRLKSDVDDALSLDFT